MILDKREIQWLKSNQIIISGILAKLIEDRKNEVIETDDPEKREKMISWVKELKLGQMVLERVKQNKENDKFTGI